MVYDPSYKIKELAKEFEELQESHHKSVPKYQYERRAKFILYIADIYWSNIREMQERPLGR